jgi:hypothetical protein
MIMIAPALLSALFTDSHAKIKAHTQQITHAQGIQTPAWGGNCMHWVVGHIVVARCNFLMLLDAPSIWDWATCKLFIPGSTPTDAAAQHVSFATLLADLDRTQEQLLAALARSAASDMQIERDGKTVGEQLAVYAAHEAYHAGQLEILRQGLK